MLPNKTKRCHRTGFQETCFRCVTEYECDLWQPLRIENGDRATGQAVSEIYGCVDRLQDVYAKNIIGRLDTVAGNVDKLSMEVKQANDAGMTNALMGLNAQVRRLANTQVAEHVAEIASVPIPQLTKEA
jgi:hypothetical protein